MGFDVLNYFAEQNAEYLHGGGSEGSIYLFSEMKLNGKEKVLEIGCGTAASLIMLKSLHPNLDLYGLEVAPKMYEKAKKRLTFCGLSHLPLLLVPPEEDYPFPANSFDIVYIESVLAILKQSELEHIINQVSRILKPEGRLAINESVWLPDVKATKIKMINDFCQENYGIIQSNDKLKDIFEWKAFFERRGFNVEFCNRVKKGPKNQSFNARQLLSRIFTLKGKIARLMSPNHRERTKTLARNQKLLFGNGPQLLDAYILIFKINKDQAFT